MRNEPRADVDSEEEEQMRTSRVRFLGKERRGRELRPNVRMMRKESGKRKQPPESTSTQTKTSKSTRRRQSARAQCVRKMTPSDGVWNHPKDSKKRGRGTCWEVEQLLTRTPDVQLQRWLDKNHAWKKSP